MQLPERYTESLQLSEMEVRIRLLNDLDRHFEHS